MITWLKYYVLKLTQLAIASESTAFMYCVIFIHIKHTYVWLEFIHNYITAQVVSFSPFEIMLLPRNI